MKLIRCNRLYAALLAISFLTVGSGALAQGSGVKTFPSYRAAAAALIAALAANDDAALKEILGAQAVDLLSSGDSVKDANARQSFLKHYREAHAFIRDAPDKVIMTVGQTAWPLPFPMVKVNGEWHFDADAGAQELAYRRIGHNELDAIQVCRALKAAQKAYAAQSHDDDPPGAYAQRFRSEPGTQNGLYWEVKEGETPSPAGALVAEAASEAKDSAQQTGKRTPFHGYYYRILKAQGAHASGGAREYVTDGKMTGGFAIVAYPAEYGRSGVMTFLVATHGPIYEKDLGSTTEDIAKSMVTFDPDRGWKPVR